MKNLLLSILVFCFLGFSSASAEEIEFNIGDKIFFSVSGAKATLIVEEVIAEGVFRTKTIDYEVEFIFVKIKKDVYEVRTINKKMTSPIVRYYKRDGKFFRDCYKDTFELSPIGDRTYFSKL